MKKVVIFGAAGHTGKYITRKNAKTEGIELSAFVRNPQKFSDMDMTGVNIIQGDALNEGRCTPNYGRAGYSLLLT